MPPRQKPPEVRQIEIPESIRNRLDDMRAQLRQESRVIYADTLRFIVEAWDAAPKAKSKRAPRAKADTKKEARSGAAG